MEKIRVNMTPCEEVKTIHASQGDNATRKWAFDLYDENGKIDSSDIKEQMIFGSRVGGTEQILPENTSDPTTSPIIADIQYPDSLRSEQTFLYRESPTSEDGQAKITKIKGNTLVWNQLVQNGNFADTSVWQTSNCTFTVSNNIAVVTPSSNYARIQQTFSFISGHDYLILFNMRLQATGNDMRLYWGNALGGGNYQFGNNTNWQKIELVKTATSTESSAYPQISNNSGTRNWELKEMMIVDLTQLNNSAITDASSFRSYYNLPYYAYTQGKLLPFKGEELKTTGKNLNNSFLKNTSAIYSDGRIDYSNTDTNRCAMYDYVTLLPGSYVISTPSTDLQSDCNIYDLDGTFIKKYYNEWKSFPYTITLEKASKIKVYCKKSDNSVFTASDYSVQIEFGSSASSYEPYTSSTINLPTLTYFSSGMKSAGSVYDEITESKAITRIGSVDLGTLNYTKQTSTRFMTTGIIDANYPRRLGRLLNFVCPKFIASIDATPYTAYGSDDRRFYFYTNDDEFADATAFKTAMSGVYLYYELATPTEEDITTASLVTEKGEAPLYYDDELIADCNETISSESGIFDAKIKLMDDNTIYSQKLQLHIERKPQ